MRVHIILLLLGLVFIPDVAQSKGQIRSQDEIKLNYKVIDMAMSRNGKYGYVLSEDGILRIYKAGWAEIASINIGQNVSKIIVADRDDEIFTIDKAGKLKLLRLSFQRDIDTSNSPFKGNQKAPIEIVVFSDFECPHCANVAKTLDRLLEKFPEKVKIVFKHCPLSYHKTALEAAQAAVAAGIQGRFWEFHDLLFESQKELSSQKIQEIAQALNLNMERFNRDRQSPEVINIVSRDVGQAKGLDIRGVPAVYINGEPQDNTQEEALIKEIQERLKGMQPIKN